MGHNSKDEAARRRAEIENRQSRLLAAVGMLQEKDVEISAASEVLKDRRAERKEITARVMALGYAMEDLTRALKDAESELSTDQLEERERMRAEMREALGQPVTQFDLFAAPKERPVDDPVSQAVAAETAGYQSAILQRDPSPPEKWAHMASDWMKGWHKGTTRSKTAREDEERLAAEEAAMNADDTAPVDDDHVEVADDFDEIDDSDDLVAAEIDE